MPKYLKFFTSPKLYPKQNRHTIYSQNKRLEKNKNKHSQISRLQANNFDGIDDYSNEETSNIKDTNHHSEEILNDDFLGTNNVNEDLSESTYNTDSQVEINESSQINNNITSIETSQISVNYNDLEMDTKTKQKQISLALLTLFFSGDFTKTGLSKIIELTQMFSDVKLPKAFVNLINRLEKSPIKYEKKWFCVECFAYVEIENQYQRRCTQCSS